MQRTIKSIALWLVVVSVLILVFQLSGCRHSKGGLTVNENRLGKFFQGRSSLESLTAVVSGDSRHVAYVVRRGAKSVVVVDGVEGKEYSMIEPETLLFSPDSKRVGYWAHRSDGKTSKEFPVIDGQEGQECDSLVSESKIRFSPDSQNLPPTFTLVHRRSHLHSHRMPTH